LAKREIADRLGYYEDGKYVTHRQLTRKPPVSFQKRVRRAWRIMNKPRELVGPVGFHNWKALGLIVLVGMGSLFVADQAVKGLTGFSPIDPRNFVWIETFGSSNLSGYDCNRAFYGVSSGYGGIRLSSDNNGPAMCLSKSQYDFSSAAQKVLDFRFRIEMNGTQNTAFEFFLTRNDTIPAVGTPDAAYVPENDANVAMIIRMVNQGSNNVLFNILIQRDPTKAISSDAYPNCEAGDLQGVCFQVTTITGTPSGVLSNPTLNLNFTGSTENTGNSGSSYTSLDGGISRVKGLPWLAFGGVNYNIGFWVVKGGGGSTQKFVEESVFCLLAAGSSYDCMSASVYLNTSTNNAPPASIDPGGFFGPLIKALVGLGVWILNSIAQFLGFIADAFVTAMDAVGGFFGLGAIGTAIRDALVGVGTWVSNVFGTIFGQAVNIATAISNTLSALVQVTGIYWTRLTSWLSAISDLLSLFWPFISFFGVGLPFSALMTYWLIQGIIMSYNSRDGAFQWMRWTWILSATLFNIMWAIGERAFDVILNVKRLLAQWL